VQGLGKNEMLTREEIPQTALIMLLLNKKTEQDLIKYIKETIAFQSSYDIFLCEGLRHLRGDCS